jgi:uncharacterized protein (DUF952 family)
MTADLIFKIVPRTEWEKVSDIYEGSSHDRADGFLHFSTWAQLPETLRRYYADQDDLVLVAVDSSRLKSELKWEHSPSRGEDFPHLYGALRRKIIAWAKPITKDDASDNFVLPG